MSVPVEAMVLHRKEDITKKVPNSSTLPLQKKLPWGSHTNGSIYFYLFLLAHIVFTKSSNYSYFFCTLSLFSDLLNATVATNVFFFNSLFTFTSPLDFMLKPQQHFPKHTVLISSKIWALFFT